MLNSSNLFQGLATLLILSLCVLLLELNSPGIAQKVGKSMHSYWAWIPDDASDNNKSNLRANVPAPFVYAAHDSRFVAFVPTSEPTILTELEGTLNAPTSEPTEFKDVQGSWGIFSAPTSEPTEVRDLEAGDLPSPPAMHLDELSPTSEPTIFDRDALEGGGQPTNEPTVFAGVPEDNTNAPPPAETEPTQPSQPTEPSQPTVPDIANTPTSEPTIFTQVPPPEPEPEEPVVVASPTSEPTTIGEVQPYIPSGPTPTSEPTMFGEIIPPEPQPEPEPEPINTFSPTSQDFVSYGPTSDPTTFPTPIPTLAV
jgi:hypothetical protein